MTVSLYIFCGSVQEVRGSAFTHFLARRFGREGMRQPNVSLSRSKSTPTSSPDLMTSLRPRVTRPHTDASNPADLKDLTDDSDTSGRAVATNPQP